MINIQSLSQVVSTVSKQVEVLGYRELVLIVIVAHEEG